LVEQLSPSLCKRAGNIQAAPPLEKSFRRTVPPGARLVVVALAQALALLMCDATVCAVAQTPMPLNDTQMSMPVSQDAPDRAKYICSSFNDNAARARAAVALSVQTYDKNALACAADLRFELATTNPNDLVAHIDALTSLLSYVDHVRSLKDFDLLQMNWAEYDLRFEHAAQLASKLIPTSRQKWPTNPAITILCAGIDRSLAGPNDPQITLAAIAQLKHAVANDPKALNGMGELLIGRSYLVLPPIFGGGVAKAIPYLTQARDISPGDPRALRYLTEAYDELGRSGEALAALRALANIAPLDSDLQLFADEWRMGEGLATRLRDPAVADTFAAKRADLMLKHPNLLSRKVEAVFGHGGDDPMTGKPQYSGEKPR
jgi:tetratricopeptide (TPR) repeat protein